MISRSSDGTERMVLADSAESKPHLCAPNTGIDHLALSVVREAATRNCRSTTHTLRGRDDRMATGTGGSTATFTPSVTRDRCSRLCEVIQYEYLPRIDDVLLLGATSSLNQDRPNARASGELHVTHAIAYHI